MTDGQWHKVEPYLDTDRKRKYDLRDIVDGIFWLARTGAKWRNLDSQFPPDRMVINHFAKLSRKGSLKRIKEVLNRMERCEVRGREESPSLLLLERRRLPCTRERTP